jgi:RimJ/RimL family protein N-acetyltransferase
LRPGDSKRRSRTRCSNRIPPDLSSSEEIPDTARRQKSPLKGAVILRDVAEGDFPVFFEHQMDPDATRMAAFPARDRKAFMAHWSRILADETVITKTILFDGHVAGNVVSFVQSGEQEVGYWVGKEYWGRGVATQALSEFLGHVETRPLYAHVARHNIASIRVLQKCGFRISGEDPEGLILKLGANERDEAQ